MDKGYGDICHLLGEGVISSLSVSLSLPLSLSLFCFSLCFLSPYQPIRDLLCPPHTPFIDTHVHLQEFCASPGNMTQNFRDPGVIHDVLLTGLSPSVTYYYSFGSAQSGTRRFFVCVSLSLSLSPSLSPSLSLCVCIFSLSVFLSLPCACLLLFSCFLWLTSFSVVFGCKLFLPVDITHPQVLAAPGRSSRPHNLALP